MNGTWEHAEALTLNAGCQLGFVGPSRRETTAYYADYHSRLLPTARYIHLPDVLSSSLKFDGNISVNGAWEHDIE